MTGLYHTPRTYFDAYCTEYQEYPIQCKLRDIGHAVCHGHDLMDDIHDILENHPHVSENSLRHGIYNLLAELNHGSAMDYYVSRQKNSLESEVRLLTEIILKRHRLPAGDRQKARLAEDASRINFRELCAMNGWTEALNEERQPYFMYSDGHWIMFPGDGEIIRQFNLQSAAENRGYVSYVYPEPWYGCPTSAKVIILGNEVRYDDYISRCQNLMLTKQPAYAETVQITVDRWLALDHGSFYNDDFIGPDKDKLTFCDIYNSPTYRFWLKKIRDFIDYLHLLRHKVYENVAVVNANPYTSINVGPLEPGLLPSHYFLRQLIRYVINMNSDTLFFLPSERLMPVWKKILGNQFNDLMAQNRLLITGCNSISLTDNWNMETIDLIHQLLLP